MKILLAIITGISVALALMGSPTVLFWALVCIRNDKYRDATFQVQDMCLSNPQRSIKLFWIVNGTIEGRNERVVIPFDDLAKKPPYDIGEVLRVKYDPQGTSIVLAGRTLRTVLPNEFAVAKHKMVVFICVFWGPGLVFAFIWLLKRYLFSWLNKAVHSRANIQICVITATLTFYGCGSSKPSAYDGIEKFSSNIKLFYERSDTNALIDLVSTDGIPSALVEAMQQSLVMPSSFGKIEVLNVQHYSIANYKPTTGIPGVYERKKLRWAIMPTHWVVLETQIHAPDSSDNRQLKTNVKLEFAVRMINDQWRIIGPVFDE